MAVLRKTNQSSVGLILVLSLAAFVLLQRDSSPLAIAMLVGVLLFHELGHYAGMRAFGYQDIRMFFIPSLARLSRESPGTSRRGRRGLSCCWVPVPGIVVAFALCVLRAAGRDGRDDPVVFAGRHAGQPRTPSTCCRWPGWTARACRRPCSSRAAAGSRSRFNRCRAGHGRLRGLLGKRGARHLRVSDADDLCLIAGVCWAQPGACGKVGGSSPRTRGRWTMRWAVRFSGRPKRSSPKD